MDNWTGQIGTYLDGELSPAETREMDAHLRACPACASTLLQQVQLKRAVKSAGRRYAPSTDFREKVRRSIATSPARSPFWAWIPAVTVAAALIVGVVIVPVRERRLAARTTYNELADLHVTALASPNPVDVVSTDRHTVKPWFEGKIPFAFNLPELQNPEITLLGGRLVYLNQSPGAELLYHIRKHQVSVFVFQERAAGHLPESDSTLQRQQDTFNFISWGGNGLRYFVVGDMAGSDLKALADLFKNAAQ